MGLGAMIVIAATLDQTYMHFAFGCLIFVFNEKLLA
jgi:hypothetical protein